MQRSQLLRLGLAVAVVLVSLANVAQTQAECTITVQPGESIQSAIDAAPEGTVICLAAGEWRESIRIDKRITLRGAGADLSVIQRDEYGEPVVKIDVNGTERVGDVDVAVESLTVTDGGLKSCGIRIGSSTQATVRDSIITDNAEGVRLCDMAQATIEDTIITSNIAYGIVLSDSTQATIDHCAIEETWRIGIAVAGSASATIESNAIRNNTDCGIFSQSEGLIQGRDNQMEGNGIDLGGNVSAELRTPLVPETEATELSYPGPYETLQETVDALAPGGTITVAGRTYWREEIGVTIWKPLTLMTDGGQVVLNVISLIDSAQGVTIDGLTMHGTYKQAFLLGGHCQATIVRCIIEGREQAISMSDAAQADIIDTIISDNEVGVFMVREAQATITGCTIERHHMDGILMGYSTRATIEDSIIKGSEAFGICLVDSATATIRRSSIEGTDYEAVSLEDSAQAIIDNCSITDNADGIGVWDSSRATITRCTVERNSGNGIAIGNSAQVTITASTSQENRTGILVTGSARATVEGSALLNNERYGIALHTAPCYDTGEVFTGLVTGEGNVIPGLDDPDGSKEGAVCPDELSFLMTEEGGQLDWRKQEE